MILSVWSVAVSSSQRQFEDVQAVKTIFITILICYLPFYCVGICTDDTKAMVGKTAIPLIKVVAPNFTSIIVFIHILTAIYSLFKKNKIKSQFPLKNDLIRAININFMKSLPSNTCLFNATVYDKMGSTHKAL